MSTDTLLPITVYGSSISYFTGKLENYFRIKGIPYQLEALTAPHCMKLVRQNTGSTQMPALLLGDGRWMTDSTAIIQWFEAEFPAPAVIPPDPLQRFFSLLLEDYADEWLWRPAMHYRWYYPEGARYASSHLARELAAAIPAPSVLKRWSIARRQRNGYSTGDGIKPDQVPGVEAIFHRTLEQLESIFRNRQFMLGDRPSLADIAFSGPFFRHFCLDPVPAQIVRQQAPAVWEWAARLWNYGKRDDADSLLTGIPVDWGPILDVIGKHYLPYLCANIDAVAKGRRRFDADIGGVHYRGARWSKYRVWCIQRLRVHYSALSVQDQDRARNLLTQHGCWEPLWRHEQLPIDGDLCSRLPFFGDAKMIDVYD
jgi:glutathione S-transferase|tara:strand:- start:1313 stop:2419 length:1107 start_codon:yes stop_codon:yes gene_type:complete